MTQATRKGTFRLYPKLFPNAHKFKNVKFYALPRFLGFPTLASPLKSRRHAWDGVGLGEPSLNPGVPLSLSFSGTFPGYTRRRGSGETWRSCSGGCCDGHGRGDDAAEQWGRGVRRAGRNGRGRGQPIAARRDSIGPFLGGFAAGGRRCPTRPVWTNSNGQSRNVGWYQVY